MSYGNSTREEEIKNNLRKDYFSTYNAEHELGDIDFAVAIPDEDNKKAETEWLLWAEAKKGSSDVLESFVQLIMTIGKAKTFEKEMPPKYLGAFDAEKIAFLPYEEVMEVFSQNDFNWKVQPSDHNTKEFRHLMRLLKEKVTRRVQIYYFGKDDKDLKKFIVRTFKYKSNATQIQVTKTNYVHIFHKWLEVVKPTISCYWDNAKEFHIYERDFFLADMLSKNNSTIKERLRVLLNNDRYVIRRGASVIGGLDFTEIYFTDAPQKGKDGLAHRQFWNRYKRPPRKVYWDFMISRIDLLVMPDVRSYKGAFFTPEIWVTKSHDYLRECLGDDWQEKYYIWDCTAGTGNMEAGLTNKYNVWASTLDESDVDVMRDRATLGANLLDSHIFQFDFLNDSFDKLPDSLRRIIDNEEDRKHLVIYFNPPSAEAGNTSRKIAKKGVSNQSKVHDTYAVGLGAYAKRELGAQFLMRIYREIPDCKIGIFAKLKILQSPYFRQFRQTFKAQLKRMFVVPANTFDNVSGNFPYAFMIFDTGIKEVFRQTTSDVYDAEGRQLPSKTILSYDGSRLLNDWLRPTWKRKGMEIGRLVCNGNDFSQQDTIVIQSRPSNNTSTFFKPIFPENLIMSCIYLAARKCVAGTWLNDRDQYLCPDDGWKDDKEFQGDCLAYALFNNIIQSKYGVNHWIPYSEEEAGAKERFQSHFMHDFIGGNISHEEAMFNNSLKSSVTQQQIGGDFASEPIALEPQRTPMTFSPIALAVLDAGRDLWRYYHSQPDANPNASYYDIRLHFQGFTTTPAGKTHMNVTSPDPVYTRLITTLRQTVKDLAAHIEPSIYRYGFLKK